jgi:hypothetical protein
MPYGYIFNIFLVKLCRPVFIHISYRDIIVFNDIRAVSVIFNMLVQIVHKNS